MDKFIRKVEKEAANVTYVLFDFFDTLVHRDVHPDTIKQMWAIKIAEDLDGITDKLLYEVRISSEKDLSQKKRNFNYSQLTEEIIKRLVNVLGRDLDKISLKERMEQVELDIEKKHLYMDEDVCKVVDSLVRQKKKFYVVSDFYMESDALRCLLETVGYQDVFEKIFVSCEYGCSKGDTKLYDVVTKEIGAIPKECLMIGDNRRNDYVKAKAKGMRACFRRYDDYKQKNSPECMENKLWAEALKEEKTFFDYYAFSLYYFTDSLYRRVRQEGVTEVFFLAREGKFLKTLFDDYLKMKTDDEIRTHYLYVSRRSTYLPSLKKLEEEGFDILFRGAPYSYDSFLDNLNFTDADKKEVREELGVAKEDFIALLEQFEKSEQYIKLRNSRTFQRIYEERRQYTREKLLKYLAQFGVDYLRDGLFIVDVGWKGTIQDNLYHLFDDKVRVSGNYLGLTQLTVVNKNNRKRGILFEFVPYPTRYSTQWSFNQLAYENVLHAAHASVKSYEEMNGKVEPVFDRIEDEVLFEHAAYIQERIRPLFRQISYVFAETVYSAEDFEKVFISIMLEGIRRCKTEDIGRYRQMDNAHYENFMYHKTIQEIREQYNRKIILEKAKKYLKKMDIVFSGKWFLKFSAILHGHSLYVLYPLYKRIVFCREKRALENLKST